MNWPPKFLRRLFPYRIWQQIFFILVFLVVIPLIFLGSFLIRSSQRAVKTSVLRDHRELAIHTTGEVKQYIEGPRQALNVTAALLGTLHADPWRQETAIVELALRYPIFERIASVNIDGGEVVTSELGTPLRDRSEEVAFQKARLGEEYVSEVIISENHIPGLTLSTPIKQLGQIKGVLLAELNLRDVWNIVDSITIGDTGTAFLIDHQGRLLSHPDKKLVLKNKNPLNPKIIKDLLSGHAGNLEEMDTQNKSWLFSYAPIHNLHWGLVIAQSSEEAFAFSQIMKLQSWLLIMLSILATVIICFILSRFMSRPINTLIEATQKVAKKDFDSRLHSARGDEIGRLFRTFNNMTTKLKEAQRSEKLTTVGKAASAIAHELKNSLVLINTYIQLLPERHKDKDFIREFSDIVPRELNSWKNMLQNMIDNAKFLQFQMTDVDINSLVKDVAALAHQRAKLKQIDFVIHANEPFPRVKGNEEKLRQVFVNLINNALEATPQGSSIIMSTDFKEVSELWTCPHIEVQIDDKGEGIASERLKNIFDPFYTTKNDGLGLGLSISQEIIRLHGGHIEVNSQEKEGTSFTVKIPMDVKAKKNNLSKQSLSI